MRLSASTELSHIPLYSLKSGQLFSLSLKCRFFMEPFYSPLSASFSFISACHRRLFFSSSFQLTRARSCRQFPSAINSCNDAQHACTLTFPYDSTPPTIYQSLHTLHLRHSPGNDSIASLMVRYFSFCY